MYDILYKCAEYAILSDHNVSNSVKIYYLAKISHKEVRYVEHFFYTKEYTKELSRPLI